MFAKAFWITTFLVLCLLAGAGDAIYEVAVASPGQTIKAAATSFVTVWIMLFSAGMATTGLGDVMDVIIKRVFGQGGPHHGCR